MQQKSRKDAQSDLTDASELRELLKLLSRQVSSLEDYQDQRGQTLPSSYAQALMVLLDFEAREERPTLTDLVELLDIDKSNVTRLCQRMKAEGHVDIVRDPNDRRAKRVSLSEEGSELAHFVNDASLERFGAIIGNFHPEERNFVLEWLERLNETIARTN